MASHGQTGEVLDCLSRREWHEWVHKVHAQMIQIAARRRFSQEAQRCSSPGSQRLDTPGQAGDAGQGGEETDNAYSGGGGGGLTWARRQLSAPRGQRQTQRETESFESDKTGDKACRSRDSCSTSRLLNTARPHADNGRSFLHSPTAGKVQLESTHPILQPPQREHGNRWLFLSKMGKRKAKAKPPPKKAKAVLPSQFDCLFCNHENSVSVTMDRKAGTGELSCKVCGQQFQTGINSLSDPVDVFSDWVDACDNVAKEAAGIGGDDDVDALDQALRRKGPGQQLDRREEADIEHEGDFDDYE